MNHRIQFLIAMMVLACVPLPVGMAFDDSYLQQIKPILKARCYACHGALKQEAGLRLDTSLSVRRGGSGGTVTGDGNPDASSLIERITAADQSIRMPPEGEPLSAEEIEELRQWIQSGAGGPDGELPEQDPREHWAFRPVTRPPVPESESTAANPVDRFVRRKLEDAGLALSRRADAEVRVRRLYLDLIGLPPTPEQLQSFLADPSQDAWEQLVDQLLNSPQYGERWGRHWMDVWRYSDW
ncbi:MAG: DUF1549 domain-containing protein, partial [Planctomycetaceae bacterium]|nr:DUF1549 domain-containing protein [Planctomycetaceae bacterium]